MNSGGQRWMAWFMGILFMGVSLAMAEVGEKEVKALGPQDWGYKGEAGPGYWGELGFPLCAYGKKQSPVDFSTGRKTISLDLEFDYRSSLLRLIHTGRTIRGIYEPGSTLKYGGRRYELTKFQFHTPSEHTIGGRTYPMEIQLLHRGDDNKLLQLAIFVAEGDLPVNGTMDALFSALPLKSGLELIGNFYINAMDLLPRDQGAFFYIGSLTTPPCTEGVTWFVYREPIHLPMELIGRMANLFGPNSRPIQKILVDKIVEPKSKKGDGGKKPSSR